MLLHPSIAESGFAALGAAVSAPVGGPDLPDPAVVCPDLLQRFAAVSDGRRDQGRVHPVAVVLVLCAAAVVAGMASFTAIAGWATDVPAEMLARLYGRRCDPPSKATIWRVVTGVDADAVDAVIGAWLLAHAAGRDAAGREVAPDEVAGREVAPGEIAPGEIAPGEIAPGEVAVREADQDATEPLAIMVDGKAVRAPPTPRATRCIYSPPRPTRTRWCWARSRSARRATRSPSSPRC